MIMTINAIDSNRIQSMLAQMKAAAQSPGNDVSALSKPANGLNSLMSTAQTPETKKVDFADALKSSLNQVNQSQLDAEKVGKDFMLGDDKTSLSDVMVAGQKANISFQATVQVRNKIITAYNDIMN